MNKISILDNLSQEQLLTIIKYAQADTHVQGIACVNVNCGTCPLHRLHSPGADDIDTCVHIVMSVDLQVTLGVAFKQFINSRPHQFTPELLMEALL